MANRLPILLCLVMMSLAVSCAFVPSPVALPPVGPSPYGSTESASTGLLQVDTAVKCYCYDRQSYCVHTDYGIYDANGDRVRSVRNAAGFHTLDPAVVRLAPGSYSIVAWADGYELVKVPVVIRPGRVTVVNLEAGKEKRFPEAMADEMVRMADGRIVGWSANAEANR